MLVRRLESKFYEERLEGSERSIREGMEVGKMCSLTQAGDKVSKEKIFWLLLLCWQQ